MSAPTFWLKPPSEEAPPRMHDDADDSPARMCPDRLRVRHVELVCTRDLGHDGRHTAGGIWGIVAAWPGTERPEVPS